MRKIIFVFALLCSLFSQAQPRIQFWVTNKPAIHVFAPNDLTDLAAWYKSDVGVTTSGSNVTSWADQSGNSRTLSNGGSTTPPILVTNVLNSLPAIRGQGFTYLTTSSVFPDHASSGITIFIVGMQPTSETTDGNHYHGFAATGDPYNSSYGWQIERNFTFSDIIIYQGAQTGQTNNSITDGTYYTIRMTVSSSGVIKSAINNGTESSNAGTPNTSPASYLRVFGAYNGDIYSSKDILEMAIFMRVLNGTEQTQMETYFKNRYNHY